VEKFDLIVICSGSGLDVANAAAQKGLKVAIIENINLEVLVLINDVFLQNFLYIVQI
jgi:pyruvate/2-oxoglutarate dehydrogenase complex dihydrolipoamide dehydrogenase (E3) component